MGEINIRIDDELKEEATKVFDDLGMDMTTAITVFLKQMVKEQRLPFQPSFEPVANILARQEALSGQGRTFDSVEEWLRELTKDMPVEMLDTQEKLEAWLDEEE